MSGAVVPEPLESGAATAQLIFTEPNIALSLVSRSDERVGFRVHLSLEALPPWVDGDELEIFEFALPFDLSALDLTRAADDWTEELAQFPER